MSTTTALLVGDNKFPFHRIEDAGSKIVAAFDGTGIDVEVTSDLDRLADLEESDVDLLIDYVTDSWFTDDQLAGLTSFVENGGGYLGIHCASDLNSASDGEGGIDKQDEPVPELYELIGGRFLTHPEQATYGVDITADHPVTEGVDDFEVYDEPYEVEVDEDAVEVLARMDHPDLTDYPIVWVREHGRGRVCYVSVGHSDEAFENESVQQLYRNGADWAVGE